MPALVDLATMQNTSEPRFRAELELVITSNPDALHRIVRVASAVPFTLVSMWFGPPKAGLRHMRMTVTGHSAGPETLRKRLDRVVDIVKVRIVE